MPLPTDKVRTDRTFRKVAGDPVGTEYHAQGFFTPDGVSTLTIRRGTESLECHLGFESRKALNAAVAKGPLVHGQMDRVEGLGFTWAYDKFGDRVFSSLKDGSYRDAAAKEWSVQEVLTDSIDEVRRLLDMAVEVERPAAQPVKPAPVGTGKRRLAL